MTYVVFDGKHVIADRLCQSKFGDNIPGRSVPLSDGNYPINGKATNVTVYFDDVKKLYMGNGYKYRDQDIKLIAISGCTRNYTDLIGALGCGVNLDDFIKMEVNCQPKNERRIFTGDTTLFTLLGNGEGRVHTDIDLKVNTVVSREFLHIGSGSDIVNTMWNILTPRKEGGNRLTALEAFVLASGHCTTVGRVFDYYDVKTGVLHYDNKLTERQMDIILTRIQARIALVDYYSERSFVNRIQ